MAYQEPTPLASRAYSDPITPALLPPALRIRGASADNDSTVPSSSLHSSASWPSYPTSTNPTTLSSPVDHEPESNKADDGSDGTRSTASTLVPASEWGPEPYDPRFTEMGSGTLEQYPTQRQDQWRQGPTLSYEQAVNSLEPYLPAETQAPIGNIQPLLQTALEEFNNLSSSPDLHEGRRIQNPQSSFQLPRPGQEQEEGVRRPQERLDNIGDGLRRRRPITDRIVVDVEQQDDRHDPEGLVEAHPQQLISNLLAFILAWISFLLAGLLFVSGMVAALVLHKISLHYSRITLAVATTVAGLIAMAGLWTIASKWEYVISFGALVAVVGVFCAIALEIQQYWEPQAQGGVL